MVVASCSSEPAPETIQSVPSPTSAEPTADAAPSPTSQEADFSDSGEISLASAASYTAKIDYSLKLSQFETSIVDDPPGFASITYSADAKATVTNTTNGRANPQYYHWSPVALYLIDSKLCSSTKQLRDKSGTAMNNGPAAMPELLLSEASSAKYCPLWLGPLLSYASAQNTPLELGQVASMEYNPGATTQREALISGIPEADVPQLITELQKPAKLVYIMTGTGTDGFSNSASSSPVGEHCNAYFKFDPQPPSMISL